MPRPSHLSPDNILRCLQVKNGPASAAEIAQGLQLKKSDNRPLFKMLSKLKKRRAIEELPGGRYRLPGRKSERDTPSQKQSQDTARRPESSPFAGRDEVKGRLVLHHDGYGFVVPDSPIPQLDGAVVNVELLRYPHGGASPTGRVIEILGRPGELGVDTEIIIRKHHLPHVFSADVLDEAERGAKPVSESQRAGREDFRHLPIVTIDGETARDFDDAVYVEHRADGSWHLQVHIADVAHYVRTGTPLDGEARLRGTSVYFPDRAVPMLPEALSNGMCSLQPREDRLVMSALMEFDAACHTKSSPMTSRLIRSPERMTYTNVNKVLEGDTEMPNRYPSLPPRLPAFNKLALLLNARRNERGSIDFDLPERVVEFDDEQRMTNITRSERNIAHRLIEELMLSANRPVA